MPLWTRVRASVVAILGSGGLVWLGLTSFPTIGLVSIAVLIVVAAVLFSRRDEPSQRLERLIMLLRRRG